MRELPEATILVNGVELTTEQSRAVRVSISIFLMELKNLPLTSGLGIAAQEAYQKSCMDVFQIIERTKT